MKTASTIFTLLWNLPTIIALIGTIREAYQSEKVQEALKVIRELIGSTAPTADGVGNDSANPEKEKQRRWFRFMRRIKVAERMSESEAQAFCNIHHIQPYGIA